MKRNKSKWKIIGLLALTVLLLTSVSCGQKKDTDAGAEKKTSLTDAVKAVWDGKYEYGTLSVGEPGDVLSNEFFDWKVNDIKTETSFYGRDAADGKVFLIVNISVTNTEDYEYEIGNSEFLCITGTKEDDEVETENSFYDEMIPDFSNLDAGDTLTGDLVFEIGEDIKEVLIDYEEFWSDGSTGNTNWIVLKL